MTGAADQDTVVLVHGLWMHGWVMRLMGMRLRRCGFYPVFFSYPSMRNSLSQNAILLSNLVANIAARRVHFIGHSLGGLLVLQMLAEYPQQRVGRIILAGSPYSGSRVATKLSRVAPGRYILGRSMLQWLNQEIPERNDQCELGVIAGHKSIGAGRLISQLPQPNDGVVAVEETKMPGTSDEIVLNVSHSGMLLSAALIRQSCSFFRTGHFLRNPELSL